jgi:hypothetical protein
MSYTDCYPYYLGCDCFRKDDPLKEIYFLIGVEIIGIKLRVTLENKNTREHSLHRTTEIKLILRPPEDILDSEIKEIWKYLDWFEGIPFESNREFLLTGINENFVDEDRVFRYSELNYISQYMRQHGIDMDDLIKNGHAKQIIKRLRPITDFL